MAKIIAKVSGGESTFRIVIPQEVIKKGQWEGVTHVLIENHRDGFLVIRRLFDDEGQKQSDA